MFKERKRDGTVVVTGKPITPLDSYPVGAIYMSVVNTDPGTIFGGTWARFANGRVIVGVDEDGVGRELIVIGDDISQIGGGFVAHGGMRDEEAFLGFGVHRIDKWFADTGRVSTAETAETKQTYYSSQNGSSQSMFSPLVLATTIFRSSIVQFLLCVMK